MEKNKLELVKTPEEVGEKDSLTVRWPNLSRLKIRNLEI